MIPKGISGWAVVQIIELLADCLQPRTLWSLLPSQGSGLISGEEGVSSGRVTQSDKAACALVGLALIHSPSLPSPAPGPGVGGGGGKKRNHTSDHRLMARMYFVC